MRNNSPINIYLNTSVRRELCDTLGVHALMDYSFWAPKSFWFN